MDSIRQWNLLKKSEALRAAHCWQYSTRALIPILTRFFNHLGDNNFGRDLFVEEMQVACYKILNVLYPLGTAKNHFIRNLKKKDYSEGNGLYKSFMTHLHEDLMRMTHLHENLS